MTYEQWDRARRQQWPEATHEYWESWLFRYCIADWNPHTGQHWLFTRQGEVIDEPKGKQK